MFERLEDFYLEYHKVLIEAMEYLEPEVIINVHTHDPDHNGLESDVVLYSPDIHSITMRNIEKKLLDN